MKRITNQELDAFLKGLTVGDKRALLMKLMRAGEKIGLDQYGVVNGLLNGQLKVVLEDASVKLVDSHGRVIPLKGMSVADENTFVHFIPPGTIDLTAIYRRTVKYFPVGTVFMSELEYVEAACELLFEVRSDKKMKNLLKRRYIPLPLPQIRAGDYGMVLEEDFLSAVAQSYEDAFPSRKFMKWRKGELVDKVVVVDERHQELVERLRQGPVVGIYFTDPLRGFDVEDDREMVRQLPRGYSLSGGFDAAVAFVAAPQIMARGYNVPDTDCAALQWQGAGRSLCFNSSDVHLLFGFRNLGTNGSFSAGLFFFR